MQIKLRFKTILGLKNTVLSFSVYPSHGTENWLKPCLFPLGIIELFLKALVCTYLFHSNIMIVYELFPKLLLHSAALY